MAAARTIIRQPTFTIALWNNVVITLIKGDVDAAGVRTIVDAFGSLYGAYPDGVAGITVLDASLKVGSADVNAEASRGMKELRNKVLHAAVVIEDRGLVASLLRAVVRTLNSVARSSLLSIASNLNEAVQTVGPYLSGSDGSSKQQLQAELLQTLSAIRGAVALT